MLDTTMQSLVHVYHIIISYFNNDVSCFVETRFVFREPPPRPGFGRRGRPIQLFTNHFELDFRGGFVYHYDVEITPGKCPRGINRQVIRQLQEDHKNALNGCKLAFDGAKNIYTTKQLPSVNGGERVS